MIVKGEVCELSRISPTATASQEWRDAWSNNLLRSECAYFELAAEQKETQLGRLLWMKAFAEEPAGCVCYGADGIRKINLRSLPRDLQTLEADFKQLGASVVRLYLRPSAEIAQMLSRLGYDSRIEIGFAGRQLIGEWNDEVRVQPVAENKDWLTKRAVYQQGGIFPDGHRYNIHKWVEIERLKSLRTGASITVPCNLTPLGKGQGEGLENRSAIDASVLGRKLNCFIIRYNSVPCGAIAAMNVGGFTRIKNVYIAPGFRRKHIAASTLHHLASRSQHEIGLGAFAIESGAGVCLYESVGLIPVCQQVEWTRTLGDNRDGSRAC